MTDIVIRASTRMVRLAYLSVFAVIAVMLWIFGGNPELWASSWALLAPAALLIFPVTRHIGLQFTKLIITFDGHLRHESGFLSKAERSVRLDRVQDVAVTQSAFQRMLGLGNITVETAGGSSRIEMRNIDDPRQVRDQILEAAKKVPPHE